jgi:hypothetical protein
MERTHTREADRGNAAEVERSLMDTLKKARPECIHTVRSLATAIYGDDGLLEERHLRAARRLVTRLQKRGVPLVPCDEEGKLLSDDEGDSRAKHGRKCMWRCYADGRLARELMDDAESRDSLADGLLALEASDSPAVFFEPRERLLRSLRSLVSKDEYDQAKRRFTAALEKASQHPEVLTGHVSQSKMHEQPAPRRTTGSLSIREIWERLTLPFPPGGSEPPRQCLRAS